MTLYEIAITNHAGYPFYQWENPNKPKKTVNVVKYTMFPIFDETKQFRRFELECGYTAAMSLAIRSQGAHIASIKRTPISAEQLSEAGNEQDIIFDIAVDPYMNERNLYYRMYRAVDNIIFTEERNRLEDNDLTVEEVVDLKSIFNDSDLRIILHKNTFSIGNAITDALKKVKGEEKKLYEYGILGVGLLSSSYNILFYKGLKSLLELSEDEIDFPGFFPDNESELDNVLSTTQMPILIEGGEAKFAYPYEKNFNFVIHNFDIGINVLGVKEPFHLIVAVKAGFPSKVTIDDLIQGIMPFLVD
jgi:hypothetical protein